MFWINIPFVTHIITRERRHSSVIADSGFRFEKKKKSEVSCWKYFDHSSNVSTSKLRNGDENYTEALETLQLTANKPIAGVEKWLSGYDGLMTSCFPAQCLLEQAPFVRDDLK